MGREGMVDKKLWNCAFNLTKGKFLQTKLTFWLIALIPAFKICWSFLQKWNQNYMQKIIMLTTSAMTMLRSREDQRVQKDCRWSVPRAQSCDKSDKTPDVKIEKRQMWQNTRCQNWEKMNKAKHSCMSLLLLFDFGLNKYCNVQPWVQTL